MCDRAACRGIFQETGRIRDRNCQVQYDRRRGICILDGHKRESGEREWIGKKAREEVQVLNSRVYEYESLLYEAGETGGAYVIFPYDIRKEFGRGRVKVHATFDGEPYDGSVVNMGVKNADGSVCYIIGVRKDIRSRIGKQPGDRVLVTVRERE